MLNVFFNNRSKYSTLCLLRWLWGILRRHRVQVCLNTLLGCTSVGLDFAFIAATKWAIDIATHRASAPLATAAAVLAGILLLQGQGAKPHAALLF